MSRSAIQLREVTQKDRRIIWEWANDPGKRESSLSPEPIPWEDHVKWFDTKLKEHGCKMFIAFDAREPVGQIRFDTGPDGEPQIDVTVRSEKRGKGYGSELIHAGVESYFRVSSAVRVHAYIKPNNVPSKRAFENAGFRCVGEDVLKNHKMAHYIKERE